MVAPGKRRGSERRSRTACLSSCRSGCHSARHSDQGRDGWCDRTFGACGASRPHEPRLGADAIRRAPVRTGARRGKGDRGAAARIGGLAGRCPVASRPSPELGARRRAGDHCAPRMGAAHGALSTALAVRSLHAAGCCQCSSRITNAEAVKGLLIVCRYAANSYRSFAA